MSLPVIMNRTDTGPPREIMTAFAKPRHRKRVRVESLIQVVASEIEINDTERAMTWWGQDEFERSKQKTRRFCKGLRQERRFSNCLTDAYQQACSSDGTASDQSFIENRRDFVDLFDDDHGARGLERHSSYLHGLRRRKHIHDIRHAVFLEQARQTLTKQNDMESLARVAQNASQRARAFALLLGEADQWAARSYHLGPNASLRQSNECAPPLLNVD